MDVLSMTLRKVKKRIHETVQRPSFQNTLEIWITNKKT